MNLDLLKENIRENQDYSDQLAILFSFVNKVT